MNKPNDEKLSPLDAFLAHLGEISREDEEIVALEEAIARERRGEAVAMKAVPVLDELRRRREDLLADVATGLATPDEIRRFDEQAASEIDHHARAKAQAGSVSAQCEQAIAGLSRRLSEARVRREALCNKTGNLLREFLLGQAETAAAEYVKACRVVRDSYLRVSAIDRILARHGLLKNGNGLLGVAPAIMLPVFELSACKGHGYRNYPGIFSDATAYIDGAFEKALRDAMVEFRSLGVPV